MREETRRRAERDDIRILTVFYDVFEVMSVNAI